MVSSGTQAKLPVIDFSNPNVKPGSPEWDSVKFQVREALEEYGCFEASSDQVAELRNAVFGATEEVFDLPSETKKLYVSDKLFRGYFRSPSGLLESMTIDEAQSAENIEQRLTTTLWPHGNISFGDGIKIREDNQENDFGDFGVEKYMDELIGSTNYCLKLLKYNAPQTSEPTLGAFAHTDQNMVTLLHQNEVGGLEIRKKSGGEWINLQPSPDSFVVVIGESLCVWLNGGLSPTYHRVMVKGDKARYSVGIFATPRGGYRVKAPEELVDDKNPMLFKPFDYEEFLGFYLTQVGRGDAGTGLTTYCCT